MVLCNDADTIHAGTQIPNSNKQQQQHEEEERLGLTKSNATFCCKLPVPPPPVDEPGWVARWTRRDRSAAGTRGWAGGEGPASKVGKHHQHNAKMPFGCKAVNLSRGK